MNYRKAMKQRASNAIIRNLQPIQASTFLTDHTKPGNTRMQNDNPNTERYITIARACLKAINDTATDNGSREQKIQAVYQAIDTAFQAEFADYRQSVAIMASVLDRIASGELNGEKAAELARKTLDQQPDNQRNSNIH